MQGRLFIKRMTLTNIKLDLKPWFQGVYIIGSFIYQQDDFNKYQTESTAIHSLEMVT